MNRQDGEQVISTNDDASVNTSQQSLVTQTGGTAALGDTPPAYSLPDVCACILEESSLAQSQVTAFRCFSQVNLGIVHRFVVLELSGEGLTHKWLRFDRRPDRRTPFAKIVASGAPANDSVSVLYNIAAQRKQH